MGKANGPNNQSESNKREISQGDIFTFLCKVKRYPITSKSSENSIQKKLIDCYKEYYEGSHNPGAKFYDESLNESPLLTEFKQTYGYDQITKEDFGKTIDKIRTRDKMGIPFPDNMKFVNRFYMKFFDDRYTLDDKDYCADLENDINDFCNKPSKKNRESGEENVVLTLDDEIFKKEEGETSREYAIRMLKQGLRPRPRKELPSKRSSKATQEDTQQQEDLQQYVQRVIWPAGFVGREKELNKIEQFFEQQNGGGIVVLNGFPGMGKRTLAQAYAFKCSSKGKEVLFCKEREIENVNNQLGSQINNSKLLIWHWNAGTIDEKEVETIFDLIKKQVQILLVTSQPIPEDKRLRDYEIRIEQLPLQEQIEVFNQARGHSAQSKEEEDLIISMLKNIGGNTQMIDQLAQGIRKGDYTLRSLDVYLTFALIGQIQNDKKIDALNEFFAAFWKKWSEWLHLDEENYLEKKEALTELYLLPEDGICRECLMEILPKETVCLWEAHYWIESVPGGEGKVRLQPCIRAILPVTQKDVMPTSKSRMNLLKNVDSYMNSSFFCYMAVITQEDPEVQQLQFMVKWIKDLCKEISVKDLGDDTQEAVSVLDSIRKYAFCEYSMLESVCSLEKGLVKDSAKKLYEIYEDLGCAQKMLGKVALAKVSYEKALKYYNNTQNQQELQKQEDITAVRLGYEIRKLNKQIQKEMQSSEEEWEDDFGEPIPLPKGLELE